MTKKEIVEKIDKIIKQVRSGEIRGQEETLIEDLKDISYEIENELD